MRELLDIIIRQVAQGNEGQAARIRRELFLYVYQTEENPISFEDLSDEAQEAYTIFENEMANQGRSL